MSEQSAGRSFFPRNASLDPRPRIVPLGRTAVLRQSRAVQPTRPARCCELTDSGPLARGRGRASHQCRRYCRRCIGGFDDTLHAAGIELYFAEMKGPVKDKLKRFGLFARLGGRTFFATLDEAVRAYRASHPIEWVDWEDRTS